MTRDLNNRTGLNPADARFLDKIEEHGWVVTKVAPRVGDEGECFAYSTGLYLRFAQPEIVMFGLPVDIMHGIINNVGNQMKTGVNFLPGRDYADLLERYPCQFRTVDKSKYSHHLGWSSWFYESLDYPVLQCFWPDTNGYFPWQSECATAVRELQPFLYLPFRYEPGPVQ
jgi:hypothetical protein